MNRRELIKRIAAGTATLYVVPAFLTSCEENPLDPDNNSNPDNTLLTVDLSHEKYSSLGPEGGFYVESNIIIINTGDKYIALSSTCTHQGCQVSYDHAEGNLPCPCHGSKFATSGSVLNGPATAPLTAHTVIQDGDILYIS